VKGLLHHRAILPRRRRLGAAGKRLSEIAKQFTLSLNTVSTCRARIMEKIETHNDVETTLYAVRHHLVSMAS
jgi:DNA-binding NarL/FixJ family response regulator